MKLLAHSFIVFFFFFFILSLIRTAFARSGSDTSGGLKNSRYILWVVTLTYAMSDAYDQHLYRYMFLYDL